MTGRAEVRRLKMVLDASFKRINEIGDDLEVKSDLARYLCVLVSGYVEKAVTEIILEHARTRAQPSILRFVESRARRQTNLNAERLLQWLGAFDPEWRRDLEGFVVDEKKDALDSIIALRHRIAHGGSVGVTLVRVRGYYESVQLVIDHIINLCLPASSS
jgi:hypothetical protein